MSTSKQDQDFASMMADDAEVKVTLPKSALDTAIDWIINEFAPGDIYPDKDLEHWAESHGYVKE